MGSVVSTWKSTGHPPEVVMVLRNYIKDRSEGVVDTGVLPRCWTARVSGIADLAQKEI
jgi:hypothetical protein